MTKAVAGSFWSMVMEAHITKGMLGGLFAMVATNEVDDATPIGAPANLGQVYALVSETHVTAAHTSGMYALVAMNEQDLVILDATGNLLSQSQY